MTDLESTATPKSVSEAALEAELQARRLTRSPILSILKPRLRHRRMHDVSSQPS